jgi:gamma-glutamylcyclotransferase (GGCT)/AIG2-like uncharacterized protein YtfP
LPKIFPIESAPKDFLLLYGSLGRGEGMHRKLGLDKALQFVGRREIHGTLYDLGDFPGLVLGSGIVVAECLKYSTCPYCLDWMHSRNMITQTSMRPFTGAQQFNCFAIAAGSPADYTAIL